MATSAQRLGSTVPVVTLVALLAALTGCSSGHVDTVSATAHRFYTALGDGNSATACELLAPETRSELEQSTGKPCSKAILAEAVASPGEDRGVDVFGSMAFVRFAEDATFLAEFDEGWLVTATACREVPGRPYDCKVKGG